MPRTPRTYTAGLSTTVAPVIAAAVDVAARAHGWKRSEWLREVVMRGLAGESDPEVRQLVAPHLEMRTVPAAPPRERSREVAPRFRDAKAGRL